MPYNVGYEPTTNMVRVGGPPHLALGVFVAVGLGMIVAVGDGAGEGVVVGAWVGAAVAEGVIAVVEAVLGSTKAVVLSAPPTF